MKPVLNLAVLAFALLPTLAFAECRGEHSDQTAASCIAGTTWDATKGTCIANPTS